MYHEDSLFTLGVAEMAGLLALTAVMTLCLLKLARRAFRRGDIWRRLLWAVGLFWAFLWLSPQVYYLFYQLIVSGLPVQFVIDWPPGAETVLRRLTFTGPATLAAHGHGVLGWALVVMAVRPGLFGRWV
ncbi:MAG TPA: hypothetical protein VMY41_10320 [Thermohalobaculum sp.]|nr:hypothetical protein [Thermohalobaculum sp.]